jgi:large subunit ribosomal protein L10
VKGKVEKSEKEVLIKELNEKFSRAKTAIVAEFNKVDVATVTNLRKKFRQGGVDYKVLKNTLAKRASKGTPIEVISEDFTGPVALVIGYGDVVAPAKILSDFIKDMETIKVRSGVLDGKRIDANAVKALAKLPSLNELRAKILGMVMQPATKVVRTIAAPGGQLARVIQARVDAQAK